MPSRRTQKKRVRSFLPTLSFISLTDEAYEDLLGERLLALAEAPLIIDDVPGFFLGDRSRDQGDHSGSRAAVLDDPHKLAIFPLLVELAIGEVAWARIEDLARFALSIAALTVAIETGAFPFIQRFTLGDAFR